MAHNREDALGFRKYYFETTIGQLFLLDFNLIEYVKITNPFGSGDDDEDDDQPSILGPDGKPMYRRRPAKRRNVREVAPTRQYAEHLKQRFDGQADLRHLGKVNPDDLPLKTRILLADLEKGSDGRKRR